MNRKVATPKQSGGEGFVYEDKTAAWFIAHLLLDNYPFNYDLGKIEWIWFQNRPDGWVLDDILIQLQTLSGSRIKVAASVKSNKQITTSGPNDDLLHDLWHQFLNYVDDENLTIFSESQDYLCVICSGLSSKVYDDLQNLIAVSKKLDSDTFYSRIEKENKGGFSKSKFKLFKGFKCPASLSKKFNISDRDIYRLLRRLILIDFDFESDSSKDNNAIIEFCKNALAKPDGKEELKLYDKLCSLRQLTSPGRLDYEGLLNQIRNSFDLKGLADHRSDWEKILRKSRIKIESIQDKIGGKITLKREDEVKELTQIIDKNQFVFTLGESGFGKTVIVRKIIEQYLTEQHRVIWVDSSAAESGNLQNHFELENTLTDLISKVSNSKCYLVIDGIDRLLKETHLDLLREALNAAKESEYWKIVVTCQTDDYDRVLRQLYRLNLIIDHQSYTINPIANKDLLETTKVFPELFDLIKHTHLSSTLKNLTYLDLIVYNLINDTSELKSNSVSESQIIEWIWDQEFEDTDYGISNSRFVQMLAERQADNFSIGVALDAFAPSDLAGAGYLTKSKLLQKKEDKLYFTHDLFGDWARFKILRQKSDFKDFSLGKDLVSPLWCKAIRLYGVFLLEETSNWTLTIERFSAQEPKEAIIRDLLLEAIIFSSSTLGHLEKLWDYFKQNNWELLDRFFDRFLIKATIANSDIIAFAKESGGYTITEASTIDRIPVYSYWPDVITFIHNHSEEIIKAKWAQPAEIAYIWLQKTPPNFPYRKEVGSVALKIAHWMIRAKGEGLWFKDNVDEIIHKAYLETVYEHEEEAILVSLKLCRRIKPKERKDKDKHPEIAEGLISRRFKIRDAKKWDDGPFERVDATFSQVCLDGYGLQSMIKANPKVAKEILLALLISSPKEVSFSFSASNYDFDLTEPRRWYPPFYTRGPFLFFLNIQPEEGINLIIQLVNFATTQWTNLFDENEYPRLTIVLEDGSKEFIGDETTYWWYRDKGPMPHSIVSALMALEKFLYDELDKQHSIDGYIQIILSSGNSVAYLGLLSSVGRYKWELFTGTLKPLLTEYHLYDWEKSLPYGAYDIEGFQIIGFQDSYLRDKGRKWHSMEHRKKSIGQVAVFYGLTDQNINHFLGQTASKWLEDFKKNPPHPLVQQFIENLILQFDKQNYAVIEVDRQKYISYKEPLEQTQKLQPSRKEAQEFSDDFLFSFRSQQDFEENKKLSLNDVKNTWESIQRFDRMEVKNPYGLSPKYQGVFGGCALLVKNKEVWEPENPDYLEWILRKTETALLEFEIDFHDLRMNDIGHSWNSFIARYLPLLWTEDFSNKKLRKLIGLTILKSSYDVIKLLFEATSKLLNWSDKNFIQLQNYLVYWSVCLYKHKLNPYSEDGLEVQFEKEKTLLLNEFINNKIDYQPIEWKDIRLSNPKRYQTYDEDISSSMEPGLDTELIYKSFHSLPLASKADSNDWPLLIYFWDQVVNQMLFELGPVQEDSKQTRMHPQEKDYWALDQLAQIILYQPNENEIDKYWKPLFNYGYQAHEWIEKLTTQLYLHTLDQKGLYPRFFKALDQMIEFASNSNTWKTTSLFNRDQLWESLFGMKYNFIENIWNRDYRDFIKLFHRQIVKWFAKNYFNQDCIGRLLRFLRTYSGEPLIKEGIPIISTHIKFQIELSKTPPLERYSLKKFEHEDSLAKTASHLWENYRDIIRYETKTMASFKEIVIYLVAKQNSIGLELQERIIE